MRRVVTQVSVITCLIVTVLASIGWVRSYFATDIFDSVENNLDEPHDHGLLLRRWEFVSANGGIELSVTYEEQFLTDDDFPLVPRPNWQIYHIKDKQIPQAAIHAIPAHRFGPVEFAKTYGRGTMGSAASDDMTFPYWLVVVLAGAPSLYFGFQWSRRGKSALRAFPVVPVAEPSSR